MSEDKNTMNSPLLMWGVFIIIPVATFALYVYEVFFQEENVTNTQGADGLYKEARLLEGKNNNLKAYINYSTIVEIHKDSPNIVEQAKQRIDKMKKSLQVEILSLAGNQKWSELRKKKNEVEKILPEKLDWLEETLKSKNKRSETSANNPITKAVVDLQQKIDILIANENFSAAFEVYKQASLKNKNRKFKKQAKQVAAHIHYEYAMSKKRSLSAKIDGADITEFKNDFPEEILEIRAHLKKYLKMSSNTDKHRSEVKNLLQKLN